MILLSFKCLKNGASLRSAAREHGFRDPHNKVGRAAQRLNGKRERSPSPEVEKVEKKQPKSKRQRSSVRV